MERIAMDDDEDAWKNPRAVAAVFFVLATIVVLFVKVIFKI
jgi:hypothetical protein